jgi:hypothetical protein
VRSGCALCGAPHVTLGAWAMSPGSTSSPRSRRRGTERTRDTALRARVRRRAGSCVGLGVGLGQWAWSPLWGCWPGDCCGGQAMARGMTTDGPVASAIDTDCPILGLPRTDLCTWGRRHSGSRHAAVRRAARRPRALTPAQMPAGSSPAGLSAQPTFCLADVGLSRSLGRGWSLSWHRRRGSACPGVPPARCCPP